MTTSSYKIRDNATKKVVESRRELLKEDKMKEYEKLVNDSEQQMRFKAASMQEYTLGKIKVNP